MIFPILNGLMSWRKAPITWTLVVFNLLVLMYTAYAGRAAQEGLEDVMKKSFFVSTQGRVYAQYLAQNEDLEYPKFLRDLGHKVEHGESARAEDLGQLAFRDFNFLNSVETIKYSGDQVAFRFWRKEIEEVRLMQESHPSFVLGLNAADTSVGKWISYIFVHSGGYHIAGNMLFLLIFGAALECQIGGLGLLVVFLLSGIFGAGVFALMTGVTGAPLVGASGAVSGVMTLFCVLNWTRPARYFYWLFLPMRGFMGLVFLPTWLIMVMWMIGDVAGYLGALAELGGIAHTAHLGGEAAGVLVGLVLFGLRKIWPVSRKPQATDDAPMGILFPFIPRAIPQEMEQNRVS